MAQLATFSNVESGHRLRIIRSGSSSTIAGCFVFGGLGYRVGHFWVSSANMSQTGRIIASTLTQLPLQAHSDL